MASHWYFRTGGTGRTTSIDAGAITATDDFAHLLEMKPGAFCLVGAGGPNAFPHHHPAFDIDERAIALTSEILARAAIKAVEIWPPCAPASARYVR